MMAKKGIMRLALLIFLILVLVVFVVQNPTLAKDVVKGIGSATAWVVKGSFSVYKESNISMNINLSEIKKDKKDGS